MNRWHDLLTMLSERRIGFRVDEKMTGTHRFLHDFEPGMIAAGAELPLEFSVTWGHPRLEKFINPFSGEFLFNVLEGTISAGGLGHELTTKGTIELGYLKNATIRYTFDFKAHGQPLRFEGEKRNLRPWNLHRTHSTCYGTIIDLSKGIALSESVVYSKLAQLPSFIASLRLS